MDISRELKDFFFFFFFLIPDFKTFQYMLEENSQKDIFHAPLIQIAREFWPPTAARTVSNSGERGLSEKLTRAFAVACFFFFFNYYYCLII